MGALVENRRTALMAVGPGPLRDGVEALLASVAQVEVVGAAGGSRSALVLAARLQPDLLFLDAGLPRGGTSRLLQSLQGQRPRVRCMVLADDAA